MAVPRAAPDILGGLRAIKEGKKAKEKREGKKGHMM